MRRRRECGATNMKTNFNPEQEDAGRWGAREKNELGFYYVFYYAVIEQD